MNSIKQKPDITQKKSFLSGDKSDSPREGTSVNVARARVSNIYSASVNSPLSPVKRCFDWAAIRSRLPDAALVWPGHVKHQLECRRAYVGYDVDQSTHSQHWYCTRLTWTADIADGTFITLTNSYKQKMSHRSRRQLSSRPDDEREEQFSPDSYLRDLAQRQAMRLRLRRKQLRRSPKEPALSLAERIVISKLDPQNFSLQAEAISATPRPTLTELIQEYRRIKAVERQLGQSMIDTVHETQDHMKRVEEFVHQPILMQGDDDIKRLEQQPPDLQHGDHDSLDRKHAGSSQRGHVWSRTTREKPSRSHQTPNHATTAASERSESNTQGKDSDTKETPDRKCAGERSTNDSGQKDRKSVNQSDTLSSPPSRSDGRLSKNCTDLTADRRSTKSPLPEIMMTAAREYRKSAGGRSGQFAETSSSGEANPTESTSGGNPEIGTVFATQMAEKDQPLQNTEMTEHHAILNNINVEHESSAIQDTQNQQATDDLSTSENTSPTAVRVDNQLCESTDNALAVTDAKGKSGTQIEAHYKPGQNGKNPDEAGTASLVGNSDSPGSTRGGVLTKETTSATDTNLGHDTEQLSDDSDSARVSSQSKVAVSTATEINTDTNVEPDLTRKQSPAHGSNLHQSPTHVSDGKTGKDLDGHNSGSLIEKTNFSNNSTEAREIPGEVEGQTQTTSNAKVKYVTSDTSQSPLNVSVHDLPDRTRSKEEDYVHTTSNIPNFSNEASDWSKDWEHSNEKVHELEGGSREERSLSNPDTINEQSDYNEKAENESCSLATNNAEEFTLKGHNYGVDSSQRESNRPEAKNPTGERKTRNVSIRQEDCGSDEILDNDRTTVHQTGLSGSQSHDLLHTAPEIGIATLETESDFPHLPSFSTSTEKNLKTGKEDQTLPKIETSNNGTVEIHSKDNHKSPARRTQLAVLPFAKTDAAVRRNHGNSSSSGNSPLKAERHIAFRRRQNFERCEQRRVVDRDLSRGSHSKRPSPESSVRDRIRDNIQFDDTDEGSDDDRIYDFIGIARERSYTLPEVLSAKHLAARGLPHRYRLRKESVDIHTVEYNKILNLSMPEQARGECFLAPGESKESSGTLPPIHINNKTASGMLPVRQDQLHVQQDVAQNPHQLPQTRNSFSYFSNRNNEPIQGDERQYRILGLYNDLKTLNVYCRSQSSVRLALSRRTMDLDMRIEWGRPLPERDSTFTLKNPPLTSVPNHSLKREDSKPDLRLPPIKTESVSEPSSVTYKPKYRHDSFIFLEDLPFPEVTPLDTDMANRDLWWFVRPGVPTQRCNGGFSAGSTRQKTRKEKAWDTLKKKCLPKVQLMRALEKNSLKGVRRLGIN
ncbi:hypothetical protein BaRGS_00026273 [Batillaria attramentaria]|uniref:Uncharacterized protein n=1 Tax=Batillaria attramentaria TaxID=370345 RepID=A0ABD0K668_9CAEN